MNQRRLEKGEAYKIAVLGALLAICLFTTYYSHFILKIEVIFTHLFYIPIILTCLWWSRKGIAVAVFLTIMLLVSHILSPLETPILGYIIRGSMFVVVGVAVGILNEKWQIFARKLIETRSYLNNIIDSSADAITIVDMKGIVRDWTKGGERFMGYRADEVIGISNRKFFAEPEEADRIMERLQREEEIRNYRAIVVRKDGKQVHICMSAALMKDKDGEPIGSIRVSREITKEVELEERLKIERDNMNQIFENMIDGVYVVSEDYEVEFMNKILLDEFGDQVGSICYKVFHGREEECPLCKLADVVNGNTVRWEWHSRRKDKTYDLIETPMRNADGSISKLTIFREKS